MKIVRWVLGALIAAWALYTAMPIVFTTAHKLGQLKNIPAEEQKYVPLMEATQWWQVGLWTLFTVLLLLVAWRIIRGGKAFMLMVLALVANLAMWWSFQGMAVYQSTFTAAEKQFDYIIMGSLVALTVVCWFLDRRKAA